MQLGSRNGTRELARELSIKELSCLKFKNCVIEANFERERAVGLVSFPLLQRRCRSYYSSYIWDMG